MTSADTEAMTALRELLDERQRYEGWLNALEERRATTPDHVYSRVQTDYSLRLDRVMERLSERAGQLGATMESLAARLVSLRARESDRMDERHEAELRTIVGEYTPEDWERRRAEADAELAGIAGERKDVEEELAEMQRIIALTQQDEAAANAEPDVASDNQSAAEIAAADASPGIQGDVPALADVPDEPDAVEAEAEEDESRGARSNDTPTASEVLAGLGESATHPSIDRFVADWGSRRTEPAAAPSVHESLTSAQGDGAPAAPEVERSAHMATSNTPSHGVPRDGDKSLKCPECGTMNYATEWYCERCGGELATV
jgi:hypothetical protein